MDTLTTPVFFEKAEAFRQWLLEHHATETGLLVGYYKVSSDKPSMTWSESVDQAICFGWIDGVRKSIDHERYSIRFTPRKPSSIWSNVNVKKAEALSAMGLMHPAGLQAFACRDNRKTGIYSFETASVAFSKEFEKKFRSHKTAWLLFNRYPLSYRRPAIHWVMSAKREETRVKRLDQLITDSESGRKIKPLSY